MATVTHTIYSHYDPEDREALEKETGQLVTNEAELDLEEAWQREAARVSRQKRLPPPQFVPATIHYDPWCSQLPTSTNASGGSRNSLGTTLSGWYRSITKTTPGSCNAAESSHRSNTQAPSNPRPTSNKGEGKPEVSASEKRDKNNWFIMKAIQSERPFSSSPAPRNPAPNLADILSRDPPPLPSEAKYRPPVWVEIGPSNKGFGMLQRSGWNEGEPLGPGVARKKPVGEHILRPDDDLLPTTISRKRLQLSLTNQNISVQKQKVEVKMENYEDVSELRNVDVIDLTMLSDDDADVDLLSDPTSSSSSRSVIDTNILQSESIKREEPFSLDEDEILNLPGLERGPTSSSATPTDLTADSDFESHGGKALLTPIATVLKSDRLGIGLKAKTVGPYKASQKRVTHNAAALLAHHKAAEESRTRRSLYGRGRRGFDKQHRREEEKRQAMLSYMKS